MELRAVGGALGNADPQASAVGQPHVDQRARLEHHDRHERRGRAVSECK